MDNIVKYIYCLSLSHKRDNPSALLGFYAKYTKLIDMRTLKLGIKENFDSTKYKDAREVLLKYLLNKASYRNEAKKHWQEIRDYCEKNGIKNGTPWVE